MIPVSSNIRQYLSDLFGESADQYIKFLNTGYNTYIRRGIRCSDERLNSGLSAYGITLQKHSKVNPAYIVLEGEELAGKTLQHLMGMYYIQSLSSMIPPIVLNPRHNELVLDLCAAPGSKTTQLAEMMENRGTLVSNEISVERVKTLVHNIDRMNLINTGVLNKQGELLSRVYSNYFDKILVDAPCSALGVLQKKQEVSRWWNEERVSVLSAIQIKLLISAVKMLKPGGEIVYSTCTLTPEENELIINLVLNKYPVEILDIELPVNASEGITLYKNEKLHSGLSRARRILPWEVNSEGFFIAKLRKTSVTESKEFSAGAQDPGFTGSSSRLIRDHLSELSENYGIDHGLWASVKFLFRGNDIFFTSSEWNAENLSAFTRIGTRFGSIGKNGKLQLHSYAAQYFSGSIQGNVYDITNPAELRSYLGGGIIRTDIHDSKVTKVIRYNDMVLGTAVPVQNGLKSQFPKSKRMQEFIIP